MTDIATRLTAAASSGLEALTCPAPYDLIDTLDTLE